MTRSFAIEYEDLPQELSLFPLTGALLLPNGQLPLNIFEPRYLNMVLDALAGTRLIGMVQPLPGTVSSQRRLCLESIFPERRIRCSQWPDDAWSIRWIGHGDGYHFQASMVWGDGPSVCTFAGSGNGWYLCNV